ncbi:MAG: hypothetical protein K2W96_28075, partial [Gemmataceae bacterium]|nr:hypothetical protein [Gemmataceae bacterium]
MTDLEWLMRLLALMVVALPAASLASLGLLAQAGTKPSERLVTRLVQPATVLALLSGIGAAGLMAWLGNACFEAHLAEWVHMPGYDFKLRLEFDRLSITFAILSLALAAVIGSFSSRYMHREPGFTRYFLLYAVFVLGMATAALSANIETLIIGWELVGLSSALLIGFFHERPGPSRNGFWVWTVYRLADAGLLLAAVLLHHSAGHGDFHALLGGPWPGGSMKELPPAMVAAGFLILLAAAGKSGLVPFSGWVPRAMEGPTPSSAVFYGALSVHLGAYLLLRVEPLLECSPALEALVVAVGLTTSAFAYLAGSVQTDIKSALSFASLSQVGLIVAEVGLGFRYLALVHLLGHACLRTLQFLRAPTLLQDYHTIENAIGDRLPRKPTPWARLSAG